MLVQAQKSPAIKISLVKLHRSSPFTFINPRWAQPLVIIGKDRVQKKTTDFFLSQTTEEVQPFLHHMPTVTHDPKH